MAVTIPWAGSDESRGDASADVGAGYIPSLGLNILALVLYALIGAGHFINVFTYRTKWGLCLPIACWTESLGFGLRILFRHDVTSGVFIATNLFVVLSPAAFLAFNYITYGRLIRQINGNVSLINPRKVTRIFVASDIFTFLVQGAGGGLIASGSSTGQIIFLVGLAGQGASYALFCVLFVSAHIRIVRARRRTTFSNEKAGSQATLANHDGDDAPAVQPTAYDQPFWTVFACLYATSVPILIRSVYRVIELAVGYNGVLYNHEKYFLGLDALPLLVAVAIWLPLWPSRYFPKHARA
ncbi:uncharacterized protein L969DRAFT_14685 [Mixia osmundae IAM 14324]|uniref:RTA1 like protein n=1 Tax=Mixia osmundae (strain CBS 9802 / IAM 14324 / JCM 22182 / KY 12970) TaxID=764103 RepID=G7E345_MIXOS|nr:uncharacterized protein L969DRAFT_14685 [Mixia osmundae IAM 14324]KEI42489.1 hypothetical protein L969DRAFT_14685 [Mixia osmundae IAM 14324]GAA97226.1 hypothetical protein E5Q_03902 [Mixia osmundae IAM 14324]